MLVSDDKWSRDQNIDLVEKLDFQSSPNENLLQIKSPTVGLSVSSLYSSPVTLCMDFRKVKLK